MARIMLYSRSESKDMRNIVFGGGRLARGLEDILNGFLELPYGGFEAWQEDDKVVLSFDVPGFNKDELSLSFDNGMLVLSARCEEKDDARKFLTNRVDRSIDRKLVLGLDASKAHAEYGVLTVSFPKSDDAKSRTIKVN